MKRHRTVLVGRHPAARFVSRVAVVGGLIGLAMLGNLRSQAVELGQPQPLSHGALASEVALTALVVDGVDDDAPNIADQDDMRLVPAIYAWDPDVRFVYYRHVSK